MKRFTGLMLLLAAVSSITTIQNAKADYSPQRAYKYKTNYYDWDRGMRDYYGYREAGCTRTFAPGAYVYTTCYNAGPTDDVYVYEQYMSGGYIRVTTYRDQAETSPYAEYWVYDDGTTRTIQYRRFYNDPYGPEYYYCPGYSNVVWVTLDWNNAWDKVIIGGYWVAVGADVLASSDDTAGQVLGLASMGIGSISISLGLDQANKESALQKQIGKEPKADAVDVQ